MSASERLVEDAATLGVTLTSADAARLLTLTEELARWNRSYNLTAISSPAAMVTHHLLDSLAVHPDLAGFRIADAGTGAGFPGLPLAVCNPQRHFTLIDSTAKKVRFVAHAASLLEQLGDGRKGAGKHGVKGFRELQRLDPSVNCADVGEAQQARRVRDEAHLLGGGVDQREVPLRIAHRERQPGEAGAGAGVRDARAREVDIDGEAVEQVVGHHGGGRADRREVIAAVPAPELGGERQQPCGIRARQRDPQGGRVLHQGLDGTQTQAPCARAGVTDHTSHAVRLLLVEDDAMIGEAIRAGLKREGFAVDWVHDAASAAQALPNEPFELLLLDLGLPGSDGLQLLKTLRGRGVSLPVLIITARDAVSDRVAGLDAGADDYLIKPFALDELAARIRALLRRKSGRPAPLLEHEGVVLDPAAHRVTQRAVEVALSPREFALLQLLMERPGTILSRAQLEERLYGWGEEVESNAVEVHIHGLRRKLGAQFILTVRGVGYRLRPSA